MLSRHAGIELGKPHLKLKLARDVKNKNKGFREHTGYPSTSKDNTRPLLKERKDPVTKNVKEAKTLNTLPVLTSKVCSQASRAPVPSSRVWSSTTCKKE